MTQVIGAGEVGSIGDLDAAGAVRLVRFAGSGDGVWSWSAVVFGCLPDGADEVIPGARTG